ncbi:MULTISPECIES: hypothetical protein [Pseudomonadati]|uniref:Anti-sigma factor n=1 Tax=Shewanella aestuarii TaxID=1028752 RepID=A0ABT0L1I5_9GAMM|nr:hypothetical protein [Shewanella aestuarii]MCL1117320.1 hypothetical protein [Shewanella aestuarii]GGN74660.1 hypothetical protein GCM10009193_13950 [Shewanella aestuarii]
MVKDNDDTFLALQDEIASLYHHGVKEQPSAQLDEAVLAMAQAELQRGKMENTQADTDSNKVVELKTWQRYRWQLSTAASVVIVAGLFMMMPMQQNSDPAQMGIPDAEHAPMSLMQAPLPAASEVSDDDVIQADVQHGAAKAINQSEIQGVAMSVQSVQSNAALEVEQQKPSSDNAKSTSLLSDLKPSSRDNMAFESEQHFSKQVELITLDTAEKAMETLKQLVATQQWPQAERYLLTMEQRFPELNSPKHPLHIDYQSIKQQLTAR